MIAVIAVPASITSAHAELRESSPAAGERLAVSPPSVRLRFTEGVELLDDAVTLLDDRGTPITLGAVVADGPVVTAEVPTLPDGGYVVDWRVVSADGHPVEGAFTFTVGDAALPDATTVGGGADGESGAAALVAGRALTYGGFAVVLGAWAFVLTSWADGRRDRRILLLVVAGAVAALTGAVVRIIAEASILGVSLDETFELRSGRAWAALVALAAAAFAVGPLLRSRIGGRTLTLSWFAATAAVGITIAFAGHGASGRIAWLGAAATVVHVAAASIWIGGLAALVICVLVTDRAGAWRVAGRFSRLALGAVVVLATTGVLQGVRQLDSVDALTGSDFGRVLLIKVAVIGAMLLAASFSRRFVRRPAAVGAAVASPTGLRRSVTTELALAVAVFAATGWLAGASPNPVAEASGPVTVSASDANAAATATATITPAATGANFLHLTIVTPEGVPPDEARIELVPSDGSMAPVDITATVLADHVMSDRFDIPYAGAWTLRVNGRYGDFDVLTFELPFTAG